VYEMTRERRERPQAAEQHQAFIAGPDEEALRELFSELFDSIGPGRAGGAAL
jgi:hypothetical protein